MDEYIAKSYLRKMAMFEPQYTMETAKDVEILLRLIDDAPTYDVARVRHGRWVDAGRGIKACSLCNHGIRGHLAIVNNYCPNCGAKMDGGADG